MNYGWQGRGRCAGQTELFFPPIRRDVWGNEMTESPSDRNRREYAAGQLCAMCPVQTQCRDYALAYEDDTGLPLKGFWGGMNSADIKRVRAGGQPTLKLPPRTTLGRPRKPAEDVDHGTHAGYVWHTKNGITPCNPCRIARRQAKAAQRRRKKEQDQ